MQQFLKPTTRMAGTWVVAAETFEKLLVALYDPFAALDARFGGETALTLARRLETGWSRGAGSFCPWHTSKAWTLDEGRAIIAAGVCAG